MHHLVLVVAVICSQGRAWEAPIVNLSCFGDQPGDECEAAATKLLHAASESGGGAFILHGHGMNDDFIDTVLSCSRRLFTEVGMEEKRRLSITGHGLTRGYVPLGGESGSDREEIKEAFSYGFEWPEGYTSFTNKLQGPNVWPAETSPEDKRVLNEWFSHATRLGLSLAEAFSSVLGEVISLCMLRPFFVCRPERTQR